MKKRLNHQDLHVQVTPEMNIVNKMVVQNNMGYILDLGRDHLESGGE